MRNIFEHNEETPPEEIPEEKSVIDCSQVFLDVAHYYNSEGMCRVCGAIDPTHELVVVECAGHSYDGRGICRVCGTIDVFRPLGHITSVVDDGEGIVVQGTLTEAGEYFMKAVDDDNRNTNSI